ncbi:hypothetical protein BOX15_Mlig019589g1 [Macrostomum lignano]|uniref:VWFA domain-containing protein n=1 Tax=Macrostomum lignano TaxID=282301 RepID=A0A267EHZ3_9PLAT|nr:hypothetical protein BOX15_Mlig019589g1 [Macrostomum lignano]
MVRWVPILALLCAILHAMRPVTAAVDQTLQPKAKGADVVRATVRKIRNSCIFPNDLGFLLRVAYVESKFGLNANTFRSDADGFGKGIWQLDKIGFDDTKLGSSTKRNLVKEKFGIDWTTMTYASANMNVPLYNALAARLLLSRKPAAIPSGIEAQAKYWKTYYNSGAGKGSVDKFISDVKSIQPCSTVGADLLFILDASGSIGSSNFQLMKQVLIAVANKLTIGPAATQVAVITFSSRINEKIEFGQHSTLSSLTSAIKALSYTSGGTNTNLALDLVGSTFQSARPLREGFPRLLIVLTDGESNNPEATRLAANRLNAYSWLERYAVGMESDVNHDELETIASCSHVYIIKSVSEITGLTDDLYELACQSSVALPTVNAGFATMSGTLPPGTPRNVRDTAVSRAIGRTYALQVTSGWANLYVSLGMENPSSAVNDYSAEATPGRSAVVFVSSADLAASSSPLSRRKRELSSSGSNSSTAANSSIVLYLSIVPKEDSGSVTYTLEARDGDARSLYPNSNAGGPTLLHWSKLALLVGMAIGVVAVFD